MNFWIILVHILGYVLLFGGKSKYAQNLGGFWQTIQIYGST